MDTIDSLSKDVCHASPKIVQRKADHLQICLEENVEANLPPLMNSHFDTLDRYRFEHVALPELDYQEISLETPFLKKVLKAPLLISSMTGGVEQAKVLNRRLAKVAQKYQIAMGVGSQRIAIENPELRKSFELRELAPDAVLLANLGAVQLNYGYGVKECLMAINMLQADALILHINPLQECIQEQGNTNFAGLIEKIARLCEQLPVPIIIKEVGHGISANVAKKLHSIGVSVIDVAGVGGTSWAKVEGLRANQAISQQLGQTFADWGIPTAQCIREIHQLDPKLPLIASGGVRNGIDVSKLLALGASLVGLASPFLKAAYHSEAALELFVETLQAELRTALFCTGCQNIHQLRGILSEKK